MFWLALYLYTLGLVTMYTAYRRGAKVAFYPAALFALPWPLATPLFMAADAVKRRFA